MSVKGFNVGGTQAQYDYDYLDNKPTIPSASTTVPENLGTASTGTATDYARADHVHKMPSASDVGAYVKPSGGIPKTDLASSVQTSLGKADTALQTAPVTSVNEKTGAVTLSASDVGALPSDTTYVASVNGKTGAATLDASDVGALSDDTVYVASVNGKTGEANLTAEDIPFVESTEYGEGTVGAGIAAAVTNAEYAKEAVIDAYPVLEKSGEVVSFDDGAVGVPVKSIKVNIAFMQSGEGDPSPSNVRPITGWTGANVTIAQGTQEGTTYPYDWQDQVGTVYGGTLDVVSGILTVDTAATYFRAAGRSNTNVSGKYRFYSNVVNDIKPPASAYEVADIASSTLTAVTMSGADGTYAANEGIAVHHTEKRIYVYLNAYAASTVANLNSYLADHPIFVVYRLATPLTYQLTPREVDSVVGTTTIYADCGDATVAYRADPSAVANRFSDAEKEKLAGIETGAQRNVNADWSATSGDSEILNKPEDLVLDADYVHTDNNYTDAEKAAVAAIGDLQDLVTEDKTSLVAAINEAATKVAGTSDAPVIIDTASGEAAIFSDGAEGVPLKSLKIDIEPTQSGEGDPSPSNVRPISPCSGFTATQRGKNLVNFKNFRTLSGGSGNSSDFEQSVVVSGSGTYSCVYYSLNLEAGVTYYFSAYGNIISGGGVRKLGLRKGTATVTVASSETYTSNGHSGFRYTPAESGEYRFCLFCKFGTSSTFGMVKYSNIQAEVGSARTAYAPYFAPKNYEVDYTEFLAQFDALGYTEYGWTHDLATGKIAVYRRGRLFEAAGRASTSEDGKYRFYSNAIAYLQRPGDSDALCGLICDKLPEVTPNNTFEGVQGISVHPSEGRFYVYLDDHANDTADEFNTWLQSNPIYVVYPMYIPKVYQFEPMEIRNQYGLNEISTNQGPIEVEYVVEPKEYIDRATDATRGLIAGIETNMTASKAYETGDILIAGDVLYKVAAPIAMGAELTPGTNVEQTTVAEQLLLLANA